MGSSMVEFDNFTYHIHNHRTNLKEGKHTFYLLCSMRNRYKCKGRGKLEVDSEGDNRSFTPTQPHNHPPLLEELALHRFKLKLKKAVEDADTIVPLRTIFEEVSQGSSPVEFKEISPFMARVRKKKEYVRVVS